MKVLVAYEMSGRVREAFRRKGHEAWSCDILPSLIPSPYHIEAPIETVRIDGEWDLVIAHPPCTALAVSGNGTYTNSKEREDALENIRWIMNWDVPKLCIENPVGVISTSIRKPDQYIQPWMFGEDASKKTGLWLKNLPLLTPTNIILKERYSNQTPSGQNKLGPSKDRAMLRGLTYIGIAEAMAEQWG
jgi:hypothetical protein